MNDDKLQIDAVKLMRTIRDEISKEIQDMDYEEEKAYLNRKVGHLIDKYKGRGPNGEKAA